MNFDPKEFHMNVYNDLVEEYIEQGYTDEEAEALAEKNIDNEFIDRWADACDSAYQRLKDSRV